MKINIHLQNMMEIMIKKEVQNYKVKGFPTLYIRSDDVVDEYLGPRDINSLSIFLENHN